MYALMKKSCPDKQKSIPNHSQLTNHFCTSIHFLICFCCLDESSFLGYSLILSDKYNCIITSGMCATHYVSNYTRMKTTTEAVYNYP